MSDISSSTKSVFRAGERVVNLSYRKIPRVQVTRSFKIGVGLVAVFSFFFGSVTAPTISTKAADTTSVQSQANERTALESQLKDLETQINQYEDQVTSYQKQGSSLKGEISTLNSKISKLNLQIQAINLTLSSLNQKISETQGQIQTTQDTISQNKQTLAVLLQNLYKNDSVSLVEIFIKHPQLSDFFGDLNNLTLLQNNVRVSIGQITDLQNQLKDKEAQFALAKADAQSVKQYQAAQKAQIDSTKAEKNQLLAATKGQESKYQTLLAQTKKTASEIRSRIFQLLGGGELSFEQAYGFAKLASGATGVDPALILAVLDRESALGQNVGRCNYKTAMSPGNQTVFLQLTSQLNINPDVVTVSCANKDGAYGGAMGPAQFVPQTWALYKNKIAAITKNNPPSPWNNADAFVATGLYLEDASVGCKQVYSAQTSINRCTAAKYYAGGNWKSYLWTYGEAVVQHAQQFGDDIATIGA